MIKEKKSSLNFKFHDSNFLEVVGLHSYCFQSPFIPFDLSESNENSYTFEIKIGRIGNKYLFSIGFCEEYICGKHYDTLVGFGFGLCGITAFGEISILDNECKIVKLGENLSYNPGDILKFTIDFKEFKCSINKNDLPFIEIIFPKKNIYFCVSNGGYNGISTIAIN